MTQPLLDHQREGVEWLRARPHAALYDEPGLGKSRQVLEEAQEPILIVAPAMILDSGTWDDELERWAPGAEAVQVAYTSLTGRVKTARGGTRPTGKLKSELVRKYGTKIGDESHHMSRDAHWTAIFQSIHSDFTRIASGTPINNWAHEAFPQLQLMFPEESRPGQRLGSYWRWAKEWFQVGPTLWSPMAVGDLREDRTWEEFREQNWGDRMLLRLRDECLDLPPLTRTEWRVPMTKRQAKAYRELKRDYVTWLENGMEVAAWTDAAQLVKLMQCATGLEVLDPNEKNGSGKLNALRQILEDRPRPTLVAAHFRNSVAAAARTAKDVGATVRTIHGGTSRPERREIIRAFKSGGLDVLVGSLDTVSEGMTLVAADQAVLLERSWRPSRNEQVIRRIHRIGQERPVQIIDLVAKGTADERVLGLLASKSDQQMRALGTEELKGLA